MQFPVKYPCLYYIRLIFTFKQLPFRELFRITTFFFQQIQSYFILENDLEDYSHNVDMFDIRKEIIDHLV